MAAVWSSRPVICAWRAVACSRTATPSPAPSAVYSKTTPRCARSSSHWGGRCAMRKAVLLSSGGMDTFLLAHHLKANGVEAEHVFVDVGQSYAQKEEAAAMFVAATVAAPFHRCSGAQLARYEHPSGIIPFRNAELILNAAQYGDDIYM